MIVFQIFQKSKEEENKAILLKKFAPLSLIQNKVKVTIDLYEFRIIILKFKYSTMRELYCHVVINQQDFQAFLRSWERPSNFEKSPRLMNSFLWLFWKELKPSKIKYSTKITNLSVWENKAEILLIRKK